MALAYYGDSLSKNIVETTEGYLICKNVPIGRTGTMKYSGAELSLMDAPDTVFDVYRDEKEVFDIATLASFEGKPVTDGHPTVDVGPHNYSQYAKGHVQNVRRKDDKIVADLVITDPILIDKVKNKTMREVSSGYNCVYLNNAGRITQNEIRGNHVAVVSEGRAGPSVSIQDQKPEFEKSTNVERRKPRMGKTKNPFENMLRLVARAVRDAKTVDEEAEIIEDAAMMLDAEMKRATEDAKREVEDGILKEAPAYVIPPDPGAKPAEIEIRASDEKEDKAEDAATVNATKDSIHDAVCEVMDSIMPGWREKSEDAKLSAQQKKHEEGELKREGEINKLLKELEDNDKKELSKDSVEDAASSDEDLGKQEEAITVPVDDAIWSEDKAADEKSEDAVTDASVKDAAINIIKDLRPAIAQIKDPDERKMVTDAVLRSVRNTTTMSPNSAVGEIAAVVTRNTQRAAQDGFSIGNIVDASQNAYDSRNPHSRLNRSKGE